MGVTHKKNLKFVFYATSLTYESFKKSIELFVGYRDHIRVNKANIFMEYIINLLQNKFWLFIYCLLLIILKIFKDHVYHYNRHLRNLPFKGKVLLINHMHT
jgi:hypothetical protein